MQPDINRIALSIQQPWAELILQGIKTLEVRSQSTNINGVIYLYTSKKPATSEQAIVAASQHHIDINSLPMGMVVGTVDLVAVTPARVRFAEDACVSKKYLRENNLYVWHLENPDHFVNPIKPKHVPYGVWFYPFQRKKK